MNQTDAFARVLPEDIHSNRAANDTKPRPILPVPDNTPDPTRSTLERFAPTGYTLTTGWRYTDAAGHLLGMVVRYDRPANGVPADKQLRPVTYCNLPDGSAGWRASGFPNPRPLYGLDRLAERPDAPVIVVEGEKAADAAAKRFPDHVAVTSNGGAEASRMADWRPLRGRAVTIWPDADEPGARYATAVAEACLKVGARSVRIVEILAGFPAGWDLADEVPAGLGDADLSAMLRNARGVADPNAWPLPLPIVSTLPPVAPFAPELLPEALRDYVMDVAERQQSAPDFVAVATLCGLAALVGNKVRIAPKQNDDWIEVPNLWGAIVGRPSAMKSPAMRSALAPLYGLQDAARKQWEEDCRDLAADDGLANLDAKDAKKRAERALKGGDRDEARRILREASDGDRDEPPCPRLIVNDATVEKLGELLNENPNGLLLIRDELPGFLAKMENEEYASDRAFYLEAFNGNSCFTYDRIGRGTVHIENCTLSIVGGVQPSRIAPIVRGAVSGAKNDGLIQRLQMTVWPDDRADWRWIDRRPHPLARQTFEDVFRRLQDIPRADGEKPSVVFFTDAAQALFREWMEEIQQEARSARLSSTMESHLLKMPKTVASLALIFQLVKGGVGAVGEAATARALDWADYLRSHADRLYAAGGIVSEDGARLIVERRRQLSEPFSAREVQRRMWSGLTDRDAVADAIEGLIATNHVREVPTDRNAAGGRPSVAYEWNPALKAEG